MDKLAIFGLMIALVATLLLAASVLAGTGYTYYKERDWASVAFFAGLGVVLIGFVCVFAALVEMFFR